MRRSFIIASFLLLTACALPPVTQNVIIQSDEFSKDVSIEGLKAFDIPFGGTFKEWFLRSWVNKDTHATTHQLYVTVRYFDEWKFFNFAADETATNLKLTEIDRHVIDCDGRCTFSETIGVDISDAALRKRIATGYKIKISAKSGDAIIFEVSPEMISKQLEAVDQYTHRPAAKKAAKSIPGAM